MAIVKCPGCATKYKLGGSAAGKKVKCKQCGKVFRVAAAPPEPKPSDDDDFLLKLSDGEDLPRPAAPAIANVPGIASSDPPPKEVWPGSASGLKPEEQRPATGFVTYLREAANALILNREPADLVPIVVVAIVLALRVPAGFVPLFGLWVILLITGWYMAFQLNIVVESAGGETRLPNPAITSGYVESVILPLLKFLVSWFVSLLPFAIGLIYYVVLDQLSWWDAAEHFGMALVGDFSFLLNATTGADMLLAFILLLSICFWPILLLVVAVEGITALVRLDLMVLTIIQTALGYGFVVLFAYAGVVGTSLVSVIVLDQIKEGEGGFGAVMGVGLALMVLEVYGSVFAMRTIGLYYRHFKKGFAWSWG